MAASSNTAKLLPDSNATVNLVPTPPATWTGDTEFASPNVAVANLNFTKWEVK